MRKEIVVVLAVLIAGYASYGVVFVVATGGVSDPPGGADGSSRAISTPGVDGDQTLRFEEMSADVGLRYTYTKSYNATHEMMSNAGVFAADYDNDGYTDVLLTGGDSPGLFENVGGEFRPASALPPLSRSVRSALFFDYDNDGWIDLLLLSMGRQPLFFENQQGEFRQRDVGFDESLAVPVGATAGDYNGDGCPDVFIIQNGPWASEHPNGMRNYSVLEGEDNGLPNLLYEGSCSTFTEVTERADISGTRWSLATSFVDLDGDGRMDIHVANDFNNDIVYLNQADGTFEKHVLGDRTNRNGMSSEIADVDTDRDLDVFVTNIYYPPRVNDEIEGSSAIRSKGNNLLINDGEGTFDERARSYGVLRGGWGWAATIADFDNDLSLDLIHATRKLSFDVPPRRLSDRAAERVHHEFSSYRYPAVRVSNGSTFERVDPRKIGFERSDGRGIARLDFDSDGDLDVIVADAAGQYKLYRNARNDGNALQIRLVGSDETSALGARVYATVGTRTQLRVRNARSDYLSQDTRTLHFGTGNNTYADVRIIWPDGHEQRLGSVRTGQRIAVSPAGIEERRDLTVDG